MKKEMKKNELLIPSKEEIKQESEKIENVNNGENKLNFIFTKTARIIIISVLALFLLLFVIVKIANVISKEYETPIRNYYDGLEQLDLNKMLEAYPRAMQESKKVRVEDTIQLIKELSEGSFTVRYVISKEDKLSELEIKELENSFKEQYNETIKIEKGYKVTVESTLEYKETESKTREQIKVIRSGWNWYIIE